jgi:hypothetical protein
LGLNIFGNLSLSYVFDAWKKLSELPERPADERQEGPDAAGLVGVGQERLDVASQGVEVERFAALEELSGEGVAGQAAGPFDIHVAGITTRTIDLRYKL